jgi:hypothetical protein
MLNMPILFISRKSGALTYRIPMGLFRPVAGRHIISCAGFLCVSVSMRAVVLRDMIKLLPLLAVRFDGSLFRIYKVLIWGFKN